MSESKLDFQELVGVNIGRASMAWSETPKGVFDSDTCARLTSEIVAAYEEIKKENTELKAALTDLVKAYLTLSQACGAGIDALNNHAKVVMSLGVDLRGGN